MTDLQAYTTICTNGFDNPALIDDKVGNAFSIVTFRTINFRIVFTVERIGNDQGISLQGTIYGEVGVGNGLVVVDVDIGSGNYAASLNFTITFDLEPVDIDITVILDHDIAIGEQFTNASFINSVNLEVGKFNIIECSDHRVGGR